MKCSVIQTIVIVVVSIVAGIALGVVTSVADGFFGAISLAAVLRSFVEPPQDKEGSIRKDAHRLEEN